MKKTRSYFSFGILKDLFTLNGWTCLLKFSFPFVFSAHVLLCDTSSLFVFIERTSTNRYSLSVFNSNSVDFTHTCHQSLSLVVQELVTHPYFKSEFSFLLPPLC